MTLPRLLLATCAVALAGAAPHASASCLSDFNAATTRPPKPERRFVLDRYVEVTGVTVTLHGENVVADANEGLDGPLYFASTAPAASVAFVNCVA